MDPEKLCSGMEALAREAAAFIKKEAADFDQDMISVKSFNQLVSYVDRGSEEIIVKGLKILFPEAGFITEEETIASEEKEWMWVIDPLDGTTNFVHKLPIYSISIALLQHKKPVAGVVYEINRDESFRAWKGGGAWLNGSRINVKSNPDLGKSLLATGFPYYDFAQMQNYLSALRELLLVSQGMRRLGSAAVDLAYVACGRFDGFFEYGLQPWDVAAGIIIIEEAGGKICDFKGGNDFLFGKTIVGSSAALFDPFFKVIHDNFRT